ncbi:MAG: F0F1 ATP synthase subunit B [Verrucomicrobiales bacterium]|jgi:F-type H+-transporting ATPase subunit b|nr:F0F1 ATP synthase subunit B [Verrucomicrobiales bacterium]
MWSSLAAWVTQSSALLAAADADSQGGVAEVIHGLGIDWRLLLSQCIIFLILFFILKKYAYRPILKLLDDRQRRVAESMANVEKIKTELAATEQTRRDILAKANESANALIAKAQADAGSLTARQALETARQVEAMLKKAEETAAQERERLANELRQEMGKLVVLTTSKVIGRTLTVEDQARLQKEAVEGLKN